MPELPEVETIRKELLSLLPFTLLKVEAGSKLTWPLKKQEFPWEELVGLTLKSIERKGKWLRFSWGPEHYLLSHLGMSGSWLLLKKGVEQLPLHTHLTFYGPETTLAYVDPRRFGHLLLVRKALSDQKWQELGVDLTSLDFDQDYLRRSLERFPNRPVKVHLLDQKYFAGVGNYIANEICAHAGIHPSRKISTLLRRKNQDIPALMLSGIKKVLDNTLESGGTTFQGGYRRTTGEKGEGLKHLVVFYQKVCRLCGVTPVKKIILAGRGTYFCPHCQK